MCMKLSEKWDPEPFRCTSTRLCGVSVMCHEMFIWDVYLKMLLNEREKYIDVLLFDCLVFFSTPTYLGTGQNLSGTRAGTIDRGRRLFFRKKLGGRRLFFRKKLGERRLSLLQNLKIHNSIFPKKAILKIKK